MSVPVAGVIAPHPDWLQLAPGTWSIPLDVPIDFPPDVPWHPVPVTIRPDVNCDGVLDGVDSAALVRCLGKSTAECLCLFDLDRAARDEQGDGVVNWQDLRRFILTRTGYNARPRGPRA